MALTITEASAVNDFIRYTLGIPKEGQQVTAVEAREAAELLADHAHKTLAAGIRRSDIAEYWRPF